MIAKPIICIAGIGFGVRTAVELFGGRDEMRKSRENDEREDSSEIYDNDDAHGFAFPFGRAHVATTEWSAARVHIRQRADGG
jgi:hypothetical protein